MSVTHHELHDGLHIYTQDSDPDQGLLISDGVQPVLHGEVSDSDDAVNGILLGVRFILLSIAPGVVEAGGSVFYALFAATPFILFSFLFPLRKALSVRLSDEEASQRMKEISAESRNALYFSAQNSRDKYPELTEDVDLVTKMIYEQESTIAICVQHRVLKSSLSISKARQFGENTAALESERDTLIVERKRITPVAL